MYADHNTLHPYGGSKDNNFFCFVDLCYNFIMCMLYRMCLMS